METAEDMLVEVGGRPNRFNTLPEELWGQIFGRLPHSSLLPSCCVSLQWKRTLLELAAAKTRSQRCLVLEKVGNAGEEGRLQWSAFDPVSEESTEMNLSFPPGWNPVVHGGIRGGGRSGLVAFWNRIAGQYWVGSPIHDEWEKIPESHGFRHLTFHRRGFQLVGEETSASYKIVQFQLNEGCASETADGTTMPNWVIQVYSSRSRTWKTEERTADPVVFWRLYDCCASGDKVYFLGSVKAPEDAETAFITGLPPPRPCPLVIWAFDVDTGALREIKSPAHFPTGNFHPFPSSIQLQVTQGPDFKDDFRVILVAAASARTQAHLEARKLYKLALDSQPKWVVEKEVDVDKLVSPRGSDSSDAPGESWGLSFLAYNPHEFLEATFPELAHREDHKVTNLLYYNKKQHKWGIRLIQSPSYEFGDLPVVPFMPCACCSVVR